MFKNTSCRITGKTLSKKYKTIANDFEYRLRMLFNNPAEFLRFNDDVASAAADAISVNLPGPSP